MKKNFIQREVSTKDERVRISRKQHIKPGEQTKVSVVSKRSGTFLIIPIRQSSVEASVSVTHGVQKVEANVPFRVYVAKFGR